MNWIPLLIPHFWLSSADFLYVKAQKLHLEPKDVSFGLSFRILLMKFYWLQDKNSASQILPGVLYRLYPLSDTYYKELEQKHNPGCSKDCKDLHWAHSTRF